MKQCRLWIVTVLTICMAIALSPSRIAHAEELAWGAVQTGSYDSPSVYTLNWSEDVLNRGGYSLSLKKQTMTPQEADFVIDYKGTIGASSLAILQGETLEQATSSANKAFTNTQKLAKNAIYLILRQDGTYAKLRIDRYTEDYSGSVTRVFFSYVLEERTGTPPVKPEPEKPKPQPDKQPDKPLPIPDPLPDKPVPPLSPGDTKLGDPRVDLIHAIYVYELEEGGVVIPWKGLLSGSGYTYDVYRSDNGGDYVKMNDFYMTKPDYTDHYAFAGRTYVYRLAIYDAQKRVVYSGPIKIIVTKKATVVKRTIEFVLEQKRAWINGVEHSLDAAPTIVNERTMVPLRFIGEALGAKVEWDDAERKVTMKLGTQVVILYIDRSEAWVNGKSVMMDVPALILESTTMVPVRFVSENLQQEVLFDNDTKRITIIDQSGQAGKDSSKGDVEPPPTGLPHPDYKYIGTWELWVPGVGREIPGGGGQYSKGGSGGLLSIYSDFTYEYAFGANVTKGKWTRVENSPDIVLIGMQYNSDWQTRQKNGVVQIFTFGMYYEATKLIQ